MLVTLALLRQFPGEKNSFFHVVEIECHDKAYATSPVFFRQDFSGIVLILEDTMTYLQKLRAVDPEAAKQKRREYAAKYKERHPEKVKSIDAAKYEKRQEKRKFDLELDAKLKEQQNQANRKFREAHPDRIKEAQASWYARNSEHSCRKSNEWKTNNPEREFDTHLMRKYGITREQYEGLLELQQGLCKICGSPPVGKVKNGPAKRLHVDHDHQTGQVRGLLCHKCNVMLGNARDDIKILETAILYLKTAHANRT